MSESDGSLCTSHPSSVMADSTVDKSSMRYSPQDQLLDRKYISLLLLSALER
jgi:hypothetical protein